MGITCEPLVKDPVSASETCEDGACWELSDVSAIPSIITENQRLLLVKWMRDSCVRDIFTSHEGLQRPNRVIPGSS